MVSEMVSMDSSLMQALGTIQASVDKAIANGIHMTEAMTESIVIDQMLIALGYDLWDYQKQGVAEGIGTIPDYTVLPKTPQQWFLEVKKWHLPLTEKEASQTVNYAHNQGNRWAVLTNGDEWRIYDAHSQQPLAEKCIFTVKALSSTDAFEFFSLLTKQAMIEDHLAKSIRERSITNIIQAELTNINSPTIKYLRKVVDSYNGPVILIHPLRY